MLFVMVAMTPDTVIYIVFLSLEGIYTNAGLHLNKEMPPTENVIIRC